MIEKILSNLYRIEVPLPKSPLKALNSYLIKADGRFLLIDTGLNREECRDALRSGLEELKVDLSQTDFFITHMHADHMGLLGNLVSEGSTVYFNQEEAYVINNIHSVPVERAKYWQSIYDYFLAYGFPEEELKQAYSAHPGQRFGLQQRINFSILKEGDTITIGDYSFNVLETPGHSPGHLCLYEPVKKLLIAGDHILHDITPNITFWIRMQNSLKKYLAGLDKVYALDVSLVLPGHRRIVKDHRKRISELQEHHQRRLTEVIGALKDSAKTAFQVAPHVTWDIDYISWEQFPISQKWFAFGETLAHLKYLAGEGLVHEETREDRVYFLLN